MNEKKEMIETLSRLTNEGQIRSHNLEEIIKSIYVPGKYGSSTELLNEIDKKITQKEKKILHKNLKSAHDKQKIRSDFLKKDKKMRFLIDQEMEAKKDKEWLANLNNHEKEIEKEKFSFGAYELFISFLVGFIAALILDKFI